MDKNEEALSNYPYLPMEFAIDGLIGSVDEHKGVDSVAVHVTVAIGSTPVRVEHHDLKKSIVSQAHQVPLVIRVLNFKQSAAQRRNRA